MNPRGREIETLLLTMFAALPLYLNFVVGVVPLVIFHVVMTGILVRVWMGRGPELIPARLMRMLAFGYIVFYFFDVWAISHSAIAASTHLVLFIAAYQPIEAVTRHNHAQRLLTTALIFIASLATSTHITIVLFVIAFGFLMLRQLIYVSHIETVRSIGRSYELTPMSRPAAFYLLGTMLIAAALFPLLPRLRNPVVQGFAGALNNATTGLSESIDFNQNRSSTPDPTVVARVWMGPQATPFFTPVRLRAAVYDQFEDNKWLQTRDEFRQIRARTGAYRLARPVGMTRTAVVQQRLIRDSRLFLPNGTYAISGLSQLYEGPTRDSFVTFLGRGEVVSYQASMARVIEPLRARRVSMTSYPVSPQVAAMARGIAGTETDVEKRAAAVEQYLVRNFQYVQRPEDLGRPMTIDEFLLRIQKGHCEYFAAGMVALMTAQDVPARIVGGFYGGRLNPLTGYLTIRREDAHAWVEVWNGTRWVTYDPTPPSLRPGTSESGLIRSYVAAISDSVTYFWDRYVLTYGLGDQIALAADMIVRARDGIRGARTALRDMRQSVMLPGVLAALTACGLILVFVSFTLWRRRPVFNLLSRHLRALGIEVGPAMTIEEALALLRKRDPEAALVLAPLIALYEEEQFSAHSDASRRRVIRQRLSELRA
ncbi:MAG TPA: transglutaminaseTgpA domain-containing protein [Thermoanaerobaculia bacterium]|nr:transglutaminaseTgpA domain-containing protein [Thermoanaerobaculia bacterium]